MRSTGDKTMRILHIADLHHSQPRWQWVKQTASSYDLLVIAGDLLDAGSAIPLYQQAAVATDWLLSLPVPTVVCSGNHDVSTSASTSTQNPATTCEWLRPLRGVGPIIGIDGDRITRDQLSLGVFGWASDPYRTDPADLLITHAPPSGCACAVTSEAPGRDLGDLDIQAALSAKPPQLVLAGHIHDPWRFSARICHGRFVVTVLVPGMRPEWEVPSHWVIDTRAGCAVHSSGELVTWAQPPAARESAPGRPTTPPACRRRRRGSGR